MLNQNMGTEQNYVTLILTVFFIYIKTEDFYKDIANDVERQFNTSKFDENDKRPLRVGKNKK